MCIIKRPKNLTDPKTKFDYVTEFYKVRLWEEEAKEDPDERKIGFIKRELKKVIITFYRRCIWKELREPFPDDKKLEFFKSELRKVNFTYKNI